MWRYVAEPAAIVLALLCLVATIREVRDRPSSAGGWLGGAAIVAAIVAGVMVWHMAAATSAYQRKAEALERVRRLV